MRLLPPPPWAQHRREADAVMLGLAATLGTGVFLVFAPAAGMAGSWLPLAIVLAALVATLAALGYSDVAARYPGREVGYRSARELTPCVGRLAGVAVLFAQVASAAAAARVFGTYVLPGHPVGIAVPLVVVIGALSSARVRWTVRAAWVLVPGLLVVLAVVVVTGLTGHVPPDVPLPGMPGMAGNAAMTNVDGIGELAGVGAGPLGASARPLGGHVTLPGVLCAAGLMFFAFAGFASTVERLRPSGAISEEAVAAGLAQAGHARPGPPGSSAPSARYRASLLVVPALVLIVLLVYLAVAAALLHSLDVPRLAAEAAPLVAGVGGADAPALGVLVRVGAAAATACALFGMLVGASHTVVAMAAHRDLPGWFGAAGSRARGWRSNLPGVAGAVLVAVLAGPVRAIAVSACAVLVYYALISMAALRLPAAQRSWPRWTSALGLPLCLVLAVLLPRTPVLIAASVLAVGWLGTALVARLARPGRRRPDGGGRADPARPGTARSPDEAGPPPPGAG